MSPSPPPPAAPEPAAAARAAPRPWPWRWRRLALWAALVALLVVAQSLLVVLTLEYERNRGQDQVETIAAGVVADLRRTLARHQLALQALLWNDPGLQQWHADASAFLSTHREVVRLERRDAEQQVTHALDSPFQMPVFTRIRRADISLETELACTGAQRLNAPSFSRSYFVPLPNGLGLEVMDLCIPVLRAGEADGFITATFVLSQLLEDGVDAQVQRGHEVTFVEGDGSRLARAGLRRGGGVFIAERSLDLPGQRLQVRVDSDAGAPRLIPNLAVALVLGLSLALFGVVLLLARDVRKRARAEAALAEALAFRKAMEDSLSTGLRARDSQGRISYVNPAFCEMVGYSAAELVGKMIPPYWPPDLVQEYSNRQARRRHGTLPASESREGFETTFMRRGGERFAVLIFEAPLRDAQGRHTGWMSAVLDVSAQRRIEELARAQQERLQATARLATVGEMASLLSHELNQPLAAIASYAAGSLNLLQAGPADVPALQHAAHRIAEQAERAGRVIKSVHDFVRRRDQSRESLRADALLDAVLPLVRLQARKSGTRIELQLDPSAPRVRCDRTMVEQVLLNLTRNGIQAMESGTTHADRVLQIGIARRHPRWVTFSVTDRGPGIPADVAPRLFTPFFTTRSEGMGLGLSLCRTVIEQHAGALDFHAVAGGGTEFRFTLPAADVPAADADDADGTPAAEPPTTAAAALP